jgi:hypothetical protein
MKKIIKTALITASIAFNCIFVFLLYILSFSLTAKPKTFCDAELANNVVIAQSKNEKGQLVLLINRDGKEIKINILEAAKNKLAFDFLSAFSAHEKHIKN